MEFLSRRIMLISGPAMALAACSPQEPAGTPTTSDPETTGGDVHPDGELAQRPEEAVFIDGAFLASPDGDLLGAPTPTGVVIWDITTGDISHEAPTEFDPEDRHHIALTWTWNGDRIAYVNSDGAVSVMDVHGSHVATIPYDGLVGALALSRDGAYVAVSGAGVEIWSIDTGEPVSQLGDGLRLQADYDAQNQLVVSSSHDQTPLRVFTADGTDLLRELGLPQPYYQLRLARDAHTAVALTHRGDVEDYEFDLSVLNLDDGAVVATHPLEAVPAGDSIHPDATHFAWRQREGEDTRRLRVMDLTTGESSVFDSAETRFQASAWNHDGTRLYTFHPDSGVLAWNPETREQLHPLPTPEPTE